MKRIGILGILDLEKVISQKFGYPVFDADYEVSRLYQNNKKIFLN